MSAGIFSLDPRVIARAKALEARHEATKRGEYDKNYFYAIHRSGIPSWPQYTLATFHGHKNLAQWISKRKGWRVATFEQVQAIFDDVVSVQTFGATPRWLQGRGQVIDRGYTAGDRYVVRIFPTQ